MTTTKKFPKKALKHIDRLPRTDIEADYHFTESEQISLGREQANILTKMEELAARKKEVMAQFKADAEALASQQKLIGRKITSGVESRRVRVIVTLRPDERMKDYWREDTREWVREANAVDSDFEQDLPGMEATKKAKADAKAAEAKEAAKETPAASTAPKPKGKPGLAGSDSQHPPEGFLLVKDGHVMMGDQIYTVDGWGPMFVHQEDEPVSGFLGVARRSHPTRTAESEGKIGSTNVGDKLTATAALKAAPTLKMDTNLGFAKPEQVLKEFRKCAKASKWDTVQIEAMVEILKGKDGDIEAMVECLRAYTEE